MTPRSVWGAAVAGWAGGGGPLWDACVAFVGDHASVCLREEAACCGAMRRSPEAVQALLAAALVGEGW